MPYKKMIRTSGDELKYLQETAIRCEIWVAEIDNKVVGFIAFKQDWVEQLFILPSYYRRGIGSALLQKAQGSYSFLQLNVEIKNEEAIATKLTITSRCQLSIINCLTAYPAGRRQ